MEPERRPSAAAPLRRCGACEQMQGEEWCTCREGEAQVNSRRLLNACCPQPCTAMQHGLRNARGPQSPQHAYHAARPPPPAGARAPHPPKSSHPARLHSLCKIATPHLQSPNCTPHRSQTHPLCSSALSCRLWQPPRHWRVVQQLAAGQRRASLCAPHRRAALWREGSPVHVVTPATPI